MRRGAGEEFIDVRVLTATEFGARGFGLPLGRVVAAAVRRVVQQHWRLRVGAPNAERGVHCPLTVRSLRTHRPMSTATVSTTEQSATRMSASGITNRIQSP